MPLKFKTLDDIFVFDIKRETIYLEPTSGKTIPYNYTEIPSIFKEPLKKSDNITSLVGIASGDRSALIKSEDEIYKLKGIIPSDRKWLVGNIPFGCLKETACLNELGASAAMNDFGSRNGIRAPMKPICYFQYETFFRDEHVSCSVQAIKGDDRLAEYDLRFLLAVEESFRRKLRNRNKISEIRELLTDRIGNWLGFWYGALERANLCWGSKFLKGKLLDTNVGAHNIVLHPTENGIGIGLVDLDYSHKNPNKKVREWELYHIKKILSSYDGTLYFLENGCTLKSIRNYFIYQSTPLVKYEAFKDDSIRGVTPPKEEDLEIIRYFEEGRKGRPPLPIDKEFFTNTEKKIISLLK